MALLAAALGCGAEQAPAPAADPRPAAPPARLAPAAAARSEPAQPVPDLVLLPENFPKDVALYPGAAVREVEAPGSGEIFASFESRDSLDQIESFYLRRFEAAGWKTRNPRPHSPEERAIFAEKQARTATVIVFGSPEIRRIDVYLFDLE